MRRVSKLVAAMSLVPVALGAATHPVLSDEVADFYKGRSVSIVIGLQAGSGFDVYARVLARHLGRHIPGNPNIVVQQMPGASGMIAANWLYNIAPKDGTAIATFSPSVITAPFRGTAVAKFEPARFSWLSNMDESAGTCGVSPAAGIRSFNDLLVRSAIFGATAAEGPSAMYARAINGLLGAKIQVAAGFQGTPAIKLAMMRGEVHGFCGLSVSTIMSSWREEYDSGAYRPIIQISARKHPILKDIPHINDYVKTNEDQQVFDMIFGILALGRFYVAPPAIPSPTREALRWAFMSTMKDPKFLADAANAEIDINPMTGEEVEAFIARMSSSSATVIERVNEALRKH
jgi:tripartite-type tricarboxylate transporter receptor subunit TctC